jgi:hypothetical protein
MAKRQTSTPHFLWNAKMRFGKTFAAYQLASAHGMETSARTHLQTSGEKCMGRRFDASHVDFRGWQFVANGGNTYDDIDKNKPFVCFASFQDFLGKNKAGGIKLKNEWAHAINWDCIILDEYHYGAWRDSAKELYDAEDVHEQEFAEGKGLDYYDENVMPLTTNAYLYLSGTPFRAINSVSLSRNRSTTGLTPMNSVPRKNGRAKDNPYLPLPRMVLLTYQMPDAISEVALKGEFNEFD